MAALMVVTAWAQEVRVLDELGMLGMGSSAQREAQIRRLVRRGPNVLPALRRCLQRDDPRQRDDALRVLRRMGKSARPALPDIERALDHTDSLTRCLAALAHARVSGERSRAAKILNTELAPMSTAASQLLWELIDDLRGRTWALPALWDGFERSRGELQKKYACAVASAAGRTSRTKLIDFIDAEVINNEGEFLLVYVEALAHLGDTYDKRLLARLEDKSAVSRLVAFEIGLRREQIPNQAYATALKSARAEPSPEVRDAARACVERYAEEPLFWQHALAWNDYDRVREVIDRALAKGTDAQLLPLLRLALRHPDVYVQKRAIGRIGRLAPGDAALRASIYDVFRKSDRDVQMQRRCITSIAAMEAGPELKALLSDDRDLVRYATCLWLARGPNGDHRVYEQVVRLLADKAGNVADMAASALANAPGEVAVPALRKALRNAREGVWGRAVRALLGWHMRTESDALQDLRTRLARLGKKTKCRSHIDALHLLWRLGDLDGAARVGLFGAMRNEDRETRFEALWAIGKLGTRAATLRGPVEQGLGVEDFEERVLRVRAFVATSGATRRSVAVALDHLVRAPNADWDELLPAFTLAGSSSDGAWLALFDHAESVRHPRRVAAALLARSDDRSTLTAPLLAQLASRKAANRTLAAVLLEGAPSPNAKLVGALRVAWIEKETRAAGATFGLLGGARALRSLAAQLDHASRAVRLGALDGLGNAALRAQPFRDELDRISKNDPDSEIRAAAARAYRLIPAPTYSAIGLGDGSGR